MGLGGLLNRKPSKNCFLLLTLILSYSRRLCDHLTTLRLFAFMKPSWEFCAIDALGLLGGILSAWNPHLVRCKSYHSFVGILLSANFKGLELVFSIVNYYGPYVNRTTFWDTTMAGAYSIFLISSWLEILTSPFLI